MTGNFCRISDSRHRISLHQAERKESERCFGVVADEKFILVSEYGCNGAEPEIVLYKHK